jgi:hypothetical protein
MSDVTNLIVVLGRYRSGYSYKDENQSHILAIKISHEGFRTLLSLSKLDSGRANPLGRVRVQWDPERSPRIGKLDYRSIQMGIPNSLIEKWVDEWIIEIEDVTARARELKRVLDEDKEVLREELVRRGLVMEEKVYEVDEELREVLWMDREEGGGTGGLSGQKKQSQSVERWRGRRQ